MIGIHGTQGTLKIVFSALSFCGCNQISSKIARNITRNTKHRAIIKGLLASHTFKVMDMVKMRNARDSNSVWIFVDVLDEFSFLNGLLWCSPSGFCHGMMVETYICVLYSSTAASMSVSSDSDSLVIGWRFSFLPNLFRMFFNWLVIGSDVQYLLYVTTNPKRESNPLWMMAKK